jgi:hypothetical protein
MHDPSVDWRYIERAESWRGVSGRLAAMVVTFVVLFVLLSVSFVATADRPQYCVWSSNGSTVCR